MKSIPVYLKNQTAGFTLIELLMTVMIVAVISIPLSMFVVRTMDSVVISEDYSMSVNLARYEMEEVKNLSYDSIISGSFPNYQGYSYDVDRIVSFFAGNALSPESLKQIVVNVRRSGDPKILTTLTTLIARNVLYGI